MPTNNQEWEEKVNLFIEKWCGDNAPHLLDTDDNDGERLREAIRQATRKAKIEGNLRREKEILIMLVDCEKEGWTIKRFIDSFTQIIDKNERESSNLKTK